MAASVNPGILEVFAELEHMWQSRDFGAMRGYWLADLPAPLYLAEEKAAFFTTWAELESYFADIKSHSKGGLVKYKPLHSTPMGAGQEMVAFTLEWNVHLTGEAVPIGGNVRGIAVFAEQKGAWKLRSYIEAPLAPIIYMRELYKLVPEARGFKPVP